MSDEIEDSEIVETDDSGRQDIVRIISLLETIDTRLTMIESRIETLEAFNTVNGDSDDRTESELESGTVNDESGNIGGESAESTTETANESGNVKPNRRHWYFRKIRWFS